MRCPVWLEQITAHRYHIPRQSLDTIEAWLFVGILLRGIKEERFDSRR